MTSTPTHGPMPLGDALQAVADAHHQHPPQWLLIAPDGRVWAGADPWTLAAAAAASSAPLPQG